VRNKQAILQPKIRKHILIKNKMTPEIYNNTYNDLQSSRRPFIFQLLLHVRIQLRKSSETSRH